MTPESQSEAVSTPKRRRYLAAAALLGGGVTIGAVVSPIGLAGAQSGDDADSTDDADTTDESVDEESDSTDGESESEGRNGRQARRGAKLGDLSEILGLSEDELRAEFEAGNSLAQVAEAQGMTTDELIAAMLASIEAHLDEAVAEGRIDADRAADRLERAEARLPELVERVPGERGERGERGNRGHRHRFGGGEVLEELGISSDELRAGFEEGKTLAEIAAEQGVDEAALVDALVAQATERLDAAVEAGRVDADRAAELADELDERIAEMIDREPGEGGRGHGHSHRGRGFGGPAGETGSTGETSETVATA